MASPTPHEGPAHTSLVRQLNTRTVLAALRNSQGALTRTELADSVGLSRPAVDGALADLIENGWVREVERTFGRTGRPAVRFEFAADRGYLVGVDLGGHNTTILVGDLRGKVLATRREKTRSSRVAKFVPDAVRRTLSEAELGSKPLYGVGIAVPGIVDGTGELRHSVVQPSWVRARLGQRVSENLGVPVSIDNDARLATLAELSIGAGRGTEDLVAIVAGHRIGAGFAIGGVVHRGHAGAAAELGAMDAMEWDRAPEELARLGGARTVFEAASGGDAAAREAVERFTRALATGLSALVLTVDPERVVIVGGVAGAGPALVEPLREALAETCYHVPDVVPSELTDLAVAHGALLLALNEFELSNLGLLALEK